MFKEQNNNKLAQAGVELRNKTKRKYFSIEELSHSSRIRLQEQHIQGFPARRYF